MKQVGTKDAFEFVFVNRQTGKPYVAIHKVWERLRKAALLPHFRVHDLRHTYSSCLVNNGFSLFLVGQLLGHADGSMAITARYAHLNTKSMHEAASSASVMIKAAMEGPTVPV